MPSNSRLIGLTVAIVIVVAMLSPMISAVDENSGTVSVTNESITASPGDWQDLKGYDLVSGSETVYWFNSTSSSYETISSPADYELNETAGEIKYNSTGVVSDGDDTKVTYDYEATGSTASTILDLLPALVALLVLAAVGAYTQDVI